MKMKYDCSAAQKTAFCSLVLMLSTIGFTVALFAFGVPMGKYSLIVPAAAIAVYSVFFDRQMLKSLFINLALLALFALLASRIFDWSYDGMYYHKQAIITLAEGWNPLRGSSLDFNGINDVMNVYVWLDNYPKGVWICSAAVYALTGILETAKSVNILFLIMLFCVAYSTFRTVYDFGGIKSSIFAAVVCLNPVFVDQLFTSYNDLAVGSLVICAALLGMKIYRECAEDIDYALLFCVAAMSCLIKFTAPLLTGLTLAGFGTGYLIKLRGKSIAARFKKPAIVIISGFLIGTAIFGFDPYIKHLAHGQNLVGDENCDIIGDNAPQGFEGKPEALKYFISLASQTNSDFTEHYKLKIPFTVHENETQYLSNADIRLGGFGLFFSGIFILAVLCALAAPASRHKMSGETVTLLATFFALGLFFPESWWARYASYTYYIPVFLLVWASTQRKPINVAAYAVTLMLVVNSSVNAFFAVKDGIYEKAILDAQLDEIKAQNKRIELRINDFPSHTKLFEEKGIEYTVSPVSLSNPTIFYRTTKNQFTD